MWQTWNCLPKISACFDLSLISAMLSCFGQTICIMRHRYDDSPVWTDLLKLKPIYLFWKYSWLYDEPICMEFPLLFHLCEQEDISHRPRIYSNTNSNSLGDPKSYLPDHDETNCSSVLCVSSGKICLGHYCSKYWCW